jgi:hypothetical protein
VVRAVYKFDFRLVIRKHKRNYDEYLLKKKLRHAAIRTRVSDRIYELSPNQRRQSLGTPAAL